MAKLFDVVKEIKDRSSVNYGKVILKRLGLKNSSFWIYVNRCNGIKHYNTPPFKFHVSISLKPLSNYEEAVETLIKCFLANQYIVKFKFFDPYSFYLKHYNDDCRRGLQPNGEHIIGAQICVYLKRYEFTLSDNEYQRYANIAIDINESLKTEQIIPGKIYVPNKSLCEPYVSMRYDNVYTLKKGPGPSTYINADAQKEIDINTIFYHKKLMKYVVKPRVYSRSFCLTKGYSPSPLEKQPQNFLKGQHSRTRIISFCQLYKSPQTQANISATMLGGLDIKNLKKGYIYSNDLLSVNIFEHLLKNTFERGLDLYYNDACLTAEVKKLKRHIKFPHLMLKNGHTQAGVERARKIYFFFMDILNSNDLNRIFVFIAILNKFFNRCVTKTDIQSLTNIDKPPLEDFNYSSGITKAKQKNSFRNFIRRQYYNERLLIISNLNTRKKLGISYLP